MSSASSTERTRRSKAAPRVTTVSEDSTTDAGFRPWHFYLLLSMAGATWAVIVSRHTQPVALILISAAVIAAGLVATAIHYTVAGFFGTADIEPAQVSGRTRDYLEREKALALRSIKELEFDHAMRKIDDKDFAEIGTRLRTRAMELIEALDSGPQSAVLGPPSTVLGPQSAGQATGGHGARTEQPGPSTEDRAPRTEHRGPWTEDRGLRTVPCPSCETENDADARFCKHCGARLG